MSLPISSLSLPTGELAEIEDSQPYNDKSRVVLPFTFFHLIKFKLGTPSLLKIEDFVVCFSYAIVEKSQRHVILMEYLSSHSILFDVSVYLHACSASSSLLFFIPGN